ncbi:hypothetical protein AVEN_207317-1, partial [Araneus ventricosus]
VSCSYTLLASRGARSRTCNTFGVEVYKHLPGDQQAFSKLEEHLRTKKTREPDPGMLSLVVFSRGDRCRDTLED